MPASLKCVINRRFVREQQWFVRAVSHAHDVDIMEFRPAFTPVGMRHDMMPPHLTPRINLAAPWHRPVEQRVVPRHLLAIGDGFDVLQKCRETTNDLAPIQLGGDFEECSSGTPASFARAAQISGDEFFGRKFPFQRRQNAPFPIVSVGHGNICHIGQHLRAAAGFESAPSHVADPERKQFLRGQQDEFLRARLLAKEIAVRGHREPLRHLQRRPQAGISSRRSAVSVVRMTTWPLNGSRWNM